MNHDDDHDSAGGDGPMSPCTLGLGRVLGSQIYDSRPEICHSVSCHSDFPMHFEPNQPKASKKCVCAVRKKGLSTQRGELQRCHQCLFRQLAYLNGVAAADEPRGAGASGMAGSLKVNNPIGDTPIFNEKKHDYGEEGLTIKLH